MIKKSVVLKCSTDILSIIFAVIPELKRDIVWLKAQIPVYEALI